VYIPMLCRHNIKLKLVRPRLQYATCTQTVFFTYVFVRQGVPYVYKTSARRAAALRARLAVRRRAATDAAAGTLPPPCAPALPAGAPVLHSRAAELPGAVFRAKNGRGSSRDWSEADPPAMAPEGAMAPPVAEAILQALVQGPGALGGARDSPSSSPDRQPGLSASPPVAGPQPITRAPPAPVPPPPVPAVPSTSPGQQQQAQLLPLQSFSTGEPLEHGV